MLSFKEFLEEDGIDYFVIVVSDNLIDEKRLLNEGNWVCSGKKDWMIRVDAAKPEIKQQRHVHIAREKHIKSKDKQVSWNEDKSKHDKKAFNSKIASIKIIQALAKQALNLPADIKLEEAEKVSELVLINEAVNELNIEPAVFIAKSGS